MHGVASGQILINEMMSANASTLHDRFDEYPDWLEIYNAGESPVDIGDYWLSDDIMALDKWSLPSKMLDPGEHTIVFASGRDIREQGVFWHTIVNKGDIWRYLVPGSSQGDEWKNSINATIAWDTGESGIGYGDGDDSTVISGAVSVYMQTSFSLESLDEISDASFYMDYDDGFVAYLNGVEIARSSNLGPPGSSVTYGQFASALHEGLMYQGFPPEHFSLTNRLGLLTTGTNVLAVEVHNFNANSSDLTSIPILVLGFTEAQPDFERGNRFLQLTDHYPHTNFRIKSSGEPVYLSDGPANVVDFIDMIRLPSDYSYGRLPAEPDSFVYFEIPTPGGPNITVPTSGFFNDSVFFDITGEEFEPVRELTMSRGGANDTIYFTTNGADPVASSSVYNGKLTFTETTVVKARILRSGRLPGPVTTRTVFAGAPHDLPVVSVSTDPYNLWDEEHGIYVMGPNANQNIPHFGANFWQDWERPVYVEVYDESHHQLIGQHAGSKIFGAWSRAAEQKSMSFFARSKYGDGSFSSKLFREKPMSKYEAFVMRNSGNDWCNSFFRDAVSGQLAREMDLDYQAYQPYVFYLNGNYWGILNMREKINEHFVAGNRSIDPDSINLLEMNAQLIQGDRSGYDHLIGYVANNPMSDPQHYAYVESLMDMQNYISYCVLNMYIDNKDWPGNNIKYWSTTAPGSKFRWIAYDMDFGLCIWNNTAYTTNNLLFTLGEGDIHNHANPDWATRLFRSLADSEPFRHRLINEFADRMNYTFLPERTIPLIDSLYYQIFNEVEPHLMLFNGMNGKDWRTFNYWKGQVEQMREFFRERAPYVTTHLMDRFNISDSYGVDLIISGEGKIRLNSIVPDEYPFRGTYFKDIPIKLEALPAPGYRFAGWSGAITSDKYIIDYDMQGDAMFNAFFEEGDIDSIQLVINEINYYSSPERNAEDWVELYNHSDMTVDLSGWELRDGFSQESYILPMGTLLYPGKYLVVSCDLPAFKSVYPETGPVLGEMSYGLDRVMDGIGLYQPGGKLHDYVVYESVSPWPTLPNGTGATLELIHPGMDNTLPGSWAASENQGTPCAENSCYDPSILGIEQLPTDSTFRATVYPTMVSDHANVEIWLLKRSHVRVSLFSVTGGLIRQLANRPFPAGRHSFQWTPSGEEAVAGVYVLRVETGNSVRSFRVVKQ